MSRPSSSKSLVSSGARHFAFKTIRPAPTGGLLWAPRANQPRPMSRSRPRLKSKTSEGAAHDLRHARRAWRFGPVAGPTPGLGDALEPQRAKLLLRRARGAAMGHTRALLDFAGLIGVRGAALIQAGQP
jgi:hypothetical protein